MNIDERKERAGKKLQKELEGNTTKVAEKIRKSICPNCGASKWLLGPRGGLARNVKCAECGEVYNILSRIGVEWRGKIYFFKE